MLLMTSPITPLPVFLSYFGCNASPAVVSTPDNLVTDYNYLPSSAPSLAHNYLPSSAPSLAHTVDGQVPDYPAAFPSSSKPCHACDPAMSPSQRRTGGSSGGGGVLRFGWDADGKDLLSTHRMLHSHHCGSYHRLTTTSKDSTDGLGRSREEERIRPSKNVE